MKNNLFFILFVLLLTTPLVYAAANPTNPLREQEINNVCAEEVRITRETMLAFGEETDARFIFHKEQVEKDIAKQLRMFKFTQGIVSFLSIFIALTAYDLFKKRRERKIKKLDASLALQARENNG